MWISLGALDGPRSFCRASISLCTGIQLTRFQTPRAHSLVARAGAAAGVPASARPRAPASPGLAARDAPLTGT
eukprot:3556282-Pyramimonas_sp.AAC.1